MIKNSETTTRHQLSILFWKWLLLFWRTMSHCLYMSVCSSMTHPFSSHTWERQQQLRADKANTVFKSDKTQAKSSPATVLGRDSSSGSSLRYQSSNYGIEKEILHGEDLFSDWLHARLYAKNTSMLILRSMWWSWWMNELSWCYMFHIANVWYWCSICYTFSVKRHVFIW